MQTAVRSARRRQGSGSTTVSFDGETYSLDDPNSDHRSEGIKRSEANDHIGAVDSFRAALQFEKHDKGGAHMNLGVALMRLGNHRDAATAKQIYFDSKLSYILNPKYLLMLELGYQNRTEWLNENKENHHYLYGGLRTSLFNLYYDY